MVFQPGNRANPKGGPNFYKGMPAVPGCGAGSPAAVVKRILTEELKDIGNSMLETTQWGTVTRIRALAHKYWEMALDGNEYCMGTILERVDGKVPQPNIHEGSNDNPIKHLHVLAFRSDI